MSSIVFQGNSFTLFPLSAKTDVSVEAPTTGKLHRFSKGPFCELNTPSDLPDQKGLYVFVVNGEVLYLGRCLSTFKKRLEQYGHISPSNCAQKGGQLTNCHINTELNAAFKRDASVEIGICAMTGSDDDIKKAELVALDNMRKINPYWNLNY